jgi:probable rRNA maturation factor
MTAARRLTIEVVTPGATRAPGLSRWLAAVAPARACGEVTVAIVPDGQVRQLNRRYRRKDAPTDVLSFPASADLPRRRLSAKAGRLRRGRPSEEPSYLGDVVIAAGVARRQAKQAGHSLQHELRVLALHGLLHLLGYDHERDGGRMARLEARLRRRGGLREGLIERHR